MVKIDLQINALWSKLTKTVKIDPATMVKIGLGKSCHPKPRIIATQNGQNQPHQNGNPKFDPQMIKNNQYTLIAMVAIVGDRGLSPAFRAAPARVYVLEEVEFTYKESKLKTSFV